MAVEAEEKGDFKRDSLEKWMGIHGTINTLCLKV